MPPYLIRGINQPLFARWEDGSQPLPPDRHGIELEIAKAADKSTGTSDALTAMQGTTTALDFDTAAAVNA